MAKKYNTDEYKQVATPANPTGGFNKLYFKADNKAYRLDSTGVETELGGSGARQITRVANQAARLALTSAVVGDLAYQVDNNLFAILTALPASTDANWQRIIKNNALSLAIGVGTTPDAATGVNNTAVGTNALNASTTGNYNTAIGSETLTTIGSQGLNTAVGARSGKTSTGSSNTFLGMDAGSSVVGSNNVFLGVSSGVTTNNGTSQSVFIGSGSGSAASGGSNNIAIGYNANMPIHNSQNNQLNIGGWVVGYGGLIGIGVPSDTSWVPSTARLEIAGTVKITGGTPGLGKVLTSDAVGLASWATPIGLQAVINSATATMNIFTNTATISNIDIVSDGGYPVTEVGVVYYPSSTAQANRYKGISPNTTGTIADPFIVSLTGLTNNTSYLAKPYVITSQGTFYGSEIAFTTLYSFTGLRFGGATITDTNLAVPLALTPKTAFPNIVRNLGSIFNENDGLIYAAPSANVNSYNSTTGALVTTGGTGWTINDSSYIYKATNTAYISRLAAGGLRKCVLSSFPTTSVVGGFASGIYSSSLVYGGFIFAAANTAFLIRKIDITTELQVASTAIGNNAKILGEDGTFLYVADASLLTKIRMSDMLTVGTTAFAGPFVESGLVYNGFLYTGENGLTTLRRYNTTTMTFDSALANIVSATRIIENNGTIFASDQNTPSTISSINPTSFTLNTFTSFTNSSGAATYILKV